MLLRSAAAPPRARVVAQRLLRTAGAALSKLRAEASNVVTASGLVGLAVGFGMLRPWLGVIVGSLALVVFGVFALDREEPRA